MNIFRFGIFGLKKEVPSNIALNYSGIALIVVSSIAYLLIKPETSNKVETNSNRNQLINTESTEQIIKKEVTAVEYFTAGKFLIFKKNALFLLFTLF